MREAFEKALLADPYDRLTHLAFSDWLDENGFDDEAEFHRLWTPEWQQSDEYLRKLAEYHCVDFDAMVCGLKEDGFYVQRGSQTLERDFDNPQEREEFYDRFRIYIRDQDWNRHDEEFDIRPFSCSC